MLGTVRRAAADDPATDQPFGGTGEIDHTRYTWGTGNDPDYRASDLHSTRGSDSYAPGPETFRLVGVG